MTGETLMMLGVILFLIGLGTVIGFEIYYLIMIRRLKKEYDEVSK